MGVVDVTHGTLCKFNQGVNCFIPDVEHERRFANLCNKKSKVYEIEARCFWLSHQLFKGPQKLIFNPSDNVVRVSVDTEHDEALRLHLQ
jgi:hypothetical protein